MFLDDKVTVRHYSKLLEGGDIFGSEGNSSDIPVFILVIFR